MWTLYHIYVTLMQQHLWTVNLKYLQVEMIFMQYENHIHICWLKYKNVIGPKKYSTDDVSVHVDMSP